MEASYGISSRRPLNPNLNCSLHNCICRYLSFIWVSRTLKLIYFETPKCGCTSIKIALDLGLRISPLHFATAYLIHSQNYCCEQTTSGGVLTTMDRGFGTSMTADTLKRASQSAAARLSEGSRSGDPVGRFEFEHFFGSSHEALNLFPGYRKFSVLRDPFDRLLSAWNMFYNSDEFCLEQRLLQCKNSMEERKSFRCFIDNIWTCPNHHFDRITNFISHDVLQKGVDIVRFNNLGEYWEGLRKEYNLPSLGRLNAARTYLRSDADRSETMNNEAFVSYYSEDYALLNQA